MPRLRLAAALTATALAALAPHASANLELCNGPTTSQVCQQVPVTEYICYHVHDPHFDFCIPPLPPRPAA